MRALPRPLLPLLPALAAAFVLVLTPGTAAAQPSQPPAPSQPGGNDLEPPSLEKRVEAKYPEGARQQRLEANVGLELVIGEDGRVTEARITAPAGSGFDEAALEAVRAFVFAPARQGGRPIRSSVQFTYEFHLPPEAAPPPPPPPPPASALPAGRADATQTGADQATLVLAQRPISAASSFAVRDREFNLRPIGSVQDILRVTPGLVLVQHSGGGKANQYFLRGFDIDHGTDLALSIDGIPINMVSHGHGQGYADTNFIIPEVVERVEVSKGPYFANQGDFATAGAVNMVSRDSFEHSSVGFGLSGSPGRGALGYRGLLIASPKFANGVKATFAAELGRQNGPFDNPEGWNKYKLFNKLTLPVNDASSITIGQMSYGGAWHGSGQIPARSVERGDISRFGSIAPDEGGYTSRHQAYVQYKLRPSENAEVKALAYVGVYKFNMFSNFTLALRDPDNGDEIEQVDRRTFYGAKLSYRVVHEIEGVRFDTTIGGDGRSDDIQNQLRNTLHRRELSRVADNDINSTFLGAYANEEVTLLKWLRLVGGGRADMVAFAVDDKRVQPPGGRPTGGVDSAHQFSPKGSVIVSPLQSEPAQLDVYVNYGHGFHSNDVRGAFANPKVTPLTRAIGEEVGARTRLFNRWDLAIALWQLDLDNETVWIGDEGTNEAGGATTRRGLELETRYEITKWLAADADITFTRSRFKANAGNGSGLALAPKQTWSGGLSARHALGPGVARAGFRFYGVGDRPASDDGALVAPGFTMFDVHAGYKLRRFDLALDVENLFNSATRAAQFATTGRLRSEPAVGAPVPANFSCGSNGRLAGGGGGQGGFAGCEDVHFTPQYPITLRLMATVYLD